MDNMIGTINGAKASSTIYNIVESTKTNNLKPYNLFGYLLSEILIHMDNTNDSFMEGLLSSLANLLEKNPYT